MLELFTNPGYLAAAGALISAPIIIHLINRMRFKRLRWAAMEFLLKSQKRNRRRLIIEQLLLLLLRCTLVALAGLLVLRFVGFSFGMFSKQDTLHVVLLDDTLSMNDQWQAGGTTKTAFKFAKDDMILGTIVKNVGQSTTNERLMILPLSKLATEPNYQPKLHQRLNDKKTVDEIKEELNSIRPGKLHVNMLVGLKRAEQILKENSPNRVTFHILSDFRDNDWSGPGAEGLQKAMLALAQEKGRVKIWAKDVAHPERVTGGTGVPAAHDNVGIVDLRAGTRVVGKGMPVTFTITLANYSAREASVYVGVYNDATGDEMPQVDFNPPLPFKVRPGETTTATFDARFDPNIKADEKYFAQISARLESPQRGPLENDGLPDDNIRHAAVEVRDKVPILIIDGKGREGRAENGDSFFLEKAILSVPGGSYEVVHGDELGGGVDTKALERADLSQYPTIILANVRELSASQLANLENYVRDGGGVAFFLGPQVSADYYNKSLYQGGKGLFPVPLKDTYAPPPNEEPRKPAFTGDPQVLLRGEAFAGGETLPIFGQLFKDKEQLVFLKDLPVARYYPVPRAGWHPELGRVVELATLPNDLPVTEYQREAVRIVQQLPLDNEAYKAYWPALKRHRRTIEQIVQPGSAEKAFRLAAALDALLNDRGDENKRADFPNLTEFWSLSAVDPKLGTLREDVKSLRDLVLYGDPFVVAGRYGKGKVLAVMTTAGKEWNDWGGGSDASLIYQPFIWETVNYLSSQGSESNLTVGTRVQIDVDTSRFKRNENLKLSRYFYKTEQGKPAEVVLDSDQFGTQDKGVRSFVFDRTLDPGFYYSKLVDNNADRKVSLASWGHVFNVDTAAEGNLQRVSNEEMDRNIIRPAPAGTIVFEGPQGSGEQLINRQSDLSESPWFFLFFLAILVCEQALAVHLSFHLKGNEAELPKQATAAQAA
jgi:Aerotolerance regulator N-terminal